MISNIDWQAYANTLRNGKWASELLRLQQPDGQWGYFHSMAAPRTGLAITTEYALRRLWLLGFTAADEPVARTLNLLRQVLRGEASLQDKAEVTHDWALFTQLMSAAWLRLFVPDDPDACAHADRWAFVVSAAFHNAAFDAPAYDAAYRAEFGVLTHGARFRDFCSFYTVLLLADRLDAAMEPVVFKHIMTHTEGIYYIYGDSLNKLPRAFESKAAVRYVMALTLLATYRHPACRALLAPCMAWLKNQATAEDLYDFGARAKDGVYLPLSDDWRRPENRVLDSTWHVRRALAAYDHSP